MITVPLWLFTILFSLAGLALLGIPTAYITGRRANVNNQLDREWLRQTGLPPLSTLRKLSAPWPSHDGYTPPSASLNPQEQADRHERGQP